MGVLMDAHLARASSRIQLASMRAVFQRSIANLAGNAHFAEAGTPDHRPRFQIRPK
jgi:hypothetical protein